MRWEVQELKEACMHRYRQDAHPTTNSELALVVLGSLTAALGLVSVVLGTANWYFHRTSARVTDWHVEAALYLGLALLVLAVILFSFFGMSRRTRGAFLGGRTLGGKPSGPQHRPEQKSVAQF